MERTLDLQSRIKVLDYPGCIPSKCMICGRGPDPDRKFIDFGQQIEFYGAIYYCDICMSEVAKAVGYIHLSVATAVENLYRELRDKYITDLAELEGYRDVFAGLRNHGIGIPNVFSVVPNLPEVATHFVAEFDSTGESAARADSGSDESSSIEGSDGISVVATYKGKRPAL